MDTATTRTTLLADAWPGIRFEGFHLDVGARTLRYHSVPVSLRPKELDLLALLAGARGRPVSKDEIVFRIWPGEEASDAAVSQTLYRLRRAFARYNPNAEYISTIPGVGYQFVAAVSPDTASVNVSEFSSRAFASYRRAMFALETHSGAGFRDALALFEQALEVDPSYVPGLVGLAQTYALGGDLLLEDPRIAYPQAKRFAAQALQQDPLSGDAYATLSHVQLLFDRDLEAAAAAANSALALAPYSTRARTAAIWECLARGDPAAALVHAQYALGIAPSSPDLTALLGSCLYFAERFEEAHAQFVEALLFDACHQRALYFDACALIMAGAFERALQRLDGILSSEFDPRVIALRAFAAARSGDRIAYTRALDQLRGARVPSHLSIAIALLGAGNTEPAAIAVTTALRAKEPGLIFAVTDPLFAPLRATRADLFDAIRLRIHDRCEKCERTIGRTELRFCCVYQCTYCEQCTAALARKCANCGGSLGQSKPSR